MNQSSSRALLGLSFLFLVVGGMAGAPEAGLASAGLAGLCAVPAIASRPKGTRIAGLVLLVAAAALAWSLLPKATEGYRRRGQRSGLNDAVTLPKIPANSSNRSAGAV